MPEADDSQEQELPTGVPRVAKTQWHRLLGKLLELLLTSVGVTVYTELQVMSDAPRADILLLRRNNLRWTDARRKLLPDGIRDRNAGRVLMEFKYTESLNSDALQQGTGYDFFFRQAQHLSKEDVQTIVVSARTPRRAFLEQCGYVVTEHPGVYQSLHPVLARINLIVINELRDEPHNAFLQCFASNRLVRRRAFAHMEQLDWETLNETLWEFVIGLQSRINKKDEAMIKSPIQEELTPESILSIGKRMRDALIATLTPEERLAGLAPEDRLAGLAPEDRLAGLAPEDRLAGLAPEEMTVLLSRIEAYLAQHEGPQPQTLPSDGQNTK